MLNGLTNRPDQSHVAKNPSTSQYYCKGKAVYNRAAYIQYILS